MELEPPKPGSPGILGSSHPPAFDDEDVGSGAEGEESLIMVGMRLEEVSVEVTSGIEVVPGMEEPPGLEVVLGVEELPESEVVPGWPAD